MTPKLAVKSFLFSSPSWILQRASKVVPKSAPKQSDSRLWVRHSLRRKARGTRVKLINGPGGLGGRGDYGNGNTTMGSKLGLDWSPSAEISSETV